MTLVHAEVRTLRKANEALSKRRRAKKTHVRQGGALVIEDATDLIAQKDAEKEVRRSKRKKEDGQNERQSTRRRCGTCRKTGHYASTC